MTFARGILVPFLQLGLLLAGVAELLNGAPDRLSTSSAAQKIASPPLGKLWVRAVRTRSSVSFNLKKLHAVFGKRPVGAPRPVWRLVVQRDTSPAAPLASAPASVRAPPSPRA